MASVAEQTQLINVYVAAGQDSQTYSYIADQIMSGPNPNQNVANWFEDAAKSTDRNRASSKTTSTLTMPRRRISTQMTLR